MDNEKVPAADIRDRVHAYQALPDEEKIRLAAEVMRRSRAAVDAHGQEKNDE
ncbi:hypothetical protein [Nocardia sp. NPDC049707]|uniref:hypothetical protein n=1 Tax=Nocardia sp. NPDC049707 TaxID=3154735 RepID=UPI0034292D85